MNRRTLLKAGLGLATISAGGNAFAEYNAVEYSPEILQSALDSGEPVLLGFHATWCSVCRAQERRISALIDNNEAYAKVRIISVDWDTYGNSKLAKELRIPRRSTLVMFKNGEEVGRVVAQTGQEAIEELFKAAV